MIIRQLTLKHGITVGAVNIADNKEIPEALKELGDPPPEICDRFGWRRRRDRISRQISHAKSNWYYCKACRRNPICRCGWRDSGGHHDRNRKTEKTKQVFLSTDRSCF